VTHLQRMTTLMQERQPQLTPDMLHLVAYVGSHSHGTFIPTTDPNGLDDVDMMGIILPPPEYVVSGLASWENWNCQHEELDIVTYSVSKWVGLLAKGNPNVLGLLWLRPEHYLKRTWLADVFIRNRDLFATKDVYKSFAGYAAGQLHKMTSYSPEIQSEIDALEKELAIAGWKLSEIMDRRPLPMPIGIDPGEANGKADRLRHLRAKYHSAYQGEKRRNLVVKNGYDTKNAAHLVRLLAMCKEFMETGVLNVFRTHDEALLKDIKNGVFKLDDVKAMAEQLFDEVKVARDASTLPDTPNIKAITKIVTEATLDAWSGTYRA
jgi:hypothetical protein